MKKKSTIKTMFLTATMLLGMGTAWADELPTPVYFNDFSSTDGLTIVGNGVFEDDADARFGKVFHNDPKLTKAIRTNYLLLPANVLSHSKETKEMTISFWVNMREAADFFWSPMFTAYDKAERASNSDEPWPHLALMARKEAALNCWGFCDLGNTYNDKGTNAQTSAWLDDKAWHYYTATLTATSVKVYIDGVLENSWTFDGVTPGQIVEGVFNAGAEYATNDFGLKYICLGGNQACNWSDPDPAFAFDDFAVYDKALTADQIKTVIDNKLNATTIVEAANIAAFNAVEDGKTVKLTLANARVNGFNDLSSTYYVEDASGATAFKGISLTKGTALNGYIVGKKGTEDVDFVNTPSQGLEYSLTVEDASLSAFEATTTELTGTAMTITEAATQANYGKLVTLSNVTIEAIGNGKNKQLTDANGNTIKARDLFGVLSADYEWPAKASKVTGVVLFYMTGWFIIPISEDAIEAAAAEPTTVTFDFTLEGEQSLRGYVGTAMADQQGWFTNNTFAVDNVSLQITGGSAPSRIYKDNNRGVNLVTYKEYTTLTFRAPENMAITKIEFTAAGNSNINNFTASSGTIEGMTWTGNADGVRFTQGGTSYLANAIVTLAAKDASTTALPEIVYTECANIAAFNALEAGTYAKVTLTDAEVIGLSADGYSTAWIQDATGGCWLQYMSLIENLAEGQKLNGSIYTVKRSSSGNTHMKEAEDTPDSDISVTGTVDSYTMAEGTIAEVNVAANLNKVVKISGATLTMTSNTAGKLTQGDASIDVNNGTETANQQLHKIADWAKDTKLENITIVAILVAKSASANQLLPISIKGTATGIQAIDDNTESDIQIYNLQGVRLNSLQRGLNIVNGKKVLVK